MIFGVIYLVQIEWHTEPLSPKLIQLAHVCGACMPSFVPLQAGENPCPGVVENGADFQPQVPIGRSQALPIVRKSPVDAHHPRKLLPTPQ